MNDLDIEIAVKVMGWTPIIPPTNDGFKAIDFYQPAPWNGPDAFIPAARQEVPRYSEDIAAAFLVVDKMCEQVFSKRQKFLDELQSECTSEGMKRDGMRVDFREIIFIMTPEKICRAALKARNGERRN